MFWTYYLIVFLISWLNLIIYIRFIEEKGCENKGYVSCFDMNDKIDFATVHFYIFVLAMIIPVSWPALLLFCVLYFLSEFIVKVSKRRKVKKF